MNKTHASNIQTAVSLSLLIVILAFALIQEQYMLALTMGAVLTAVGSITVFAHRKKKGKMGE